MLWSGIGRLLALIVGLSLVGCIFPDNGESCRATVTSTSVICFQSNPDDCGLIWGCVATGTCQPSRCLDEDFDTCSQDDQYCAWTDTWGCRPGGPGGIERYCLVEQTQADCEQKSDYCSWVVGCDGHPQRVNCGTLDREECEQVPRQCYWNLGGQG